MNVLVDTSVWVAHFKVRDDHLVGLLDAGRVVCHPWVIAELACGTPPDRRVVLDSLADLPGTPVATIAEILGFIERHRLHGRGCGLVDIGLLAAVRLAERPTRLWTLDRRLGVLADELGGRHQPLQAD